VYQDHHLLDWTLVQENLYFFLRPPSSVMKRCGRRGTVNGYKIKFEKKIKKIFGGT